MSLLQASSRKASEWNKLQDIQNSMDLYGIAGNEAQENHEYRNAVSHYSRALQFAQQAMDIITSNDDCTSTKGSSSITDMITSRIKFVGERSYAYRKLKQYDKELRDLNYIMHTVIDDHALISKLLTRRAKIFEKLGNIPQALSDFASIPGIHSSTDHKQRADKVNFRCSKSREIKCLQIDKYSKNMWHRIKASQPNMKRNDIMFKLNFTKYPPNSMIQHEGKIYFYGKWDNSSNIAFREITIWFDEVENNGGFESRSIPLPQIISKYARLLKWKDRILLFVSPYYPLFSLECHKLHDIGDKGSNPWKMVETHETESMNSKEVISNCWLPGLQYKSISTVIMKDVLYAFTTASKCIFKIEDECGRLLALDLTTNEWRCISELQHAIKFAGQIMWCDERCGESGSIYIAFGCCPDCIEYKDHDTCSCDYGIGKNYARRYDVARNEWYFEGLNGNFPMKRGAAGCAMMDGNKLVLFGGGLNMKARFPELNDCFEYSNKRKVWRMIHADNAPCARIQPAMCQLGDLIVLHGGYQVITDPEIKSYQRFMEIPVRIVNLKQLNDLWILDTKQLMGKYRKMRRCKYCRKTRDECKLWLCKQCQNVRYCSKSCQKRHWLIHKRHCD